MNRETIKEIMQSEGILPQSKFGQNFLCDETIISDIVSLCELSRETHVLEVGPGLGSITYPISEQSDHLTCVEIDRGLACYLKENITNAEIVNSDFLKYECTDKPEVVVSNIPYYVMTDIMKKLFGEYYNAWAKFSSDSEAKARVRTQAVADYVKANGLKVTQYHDYGWDPVTLPTQ